MTGLLITKQAELHEPGLYYNTFIAGMQCDTPLTNTCQEDIIIQSVS